jgi:sugar O-acyltransferase (sialic acid O-acetyltransferase NeuD family)
MEMMKLVIYGAANPEIVKLVDAINGEKKTWDIIGFLDDLKEGEIDSYMDYPILGGEGMIEKYRDQGCSFINNVFGTTQNRRLVTEKLDKCQVNYASLISPKVDTRYVKIAADCTVLDGVILGAQVSIGKHVMIRANSSINHDTIVEEYAFVGPGVTVCGNVKLGKGSYIGAGAVIKDGLTIGAWSTISMGSIVNRDVRKCDVVAMPPAKSVKKLIVQK